MQHHVFVFCVSFSQSKNEILISLPIKYLVADSFKGRVGMAQFILRVRHIVLLKTPVVM